MSIDFTIQQFLLAFSGLIAIVNPIGGAFIFAQVTTAYSHAERVLLSRNRDVSIAELLESGRTEGFVGILRFELHLPESTSLKGKRRHLLQVKSRLERRFGGSVAEIDHHDLWQRSLLVMVIARRDAGDATRALEQARGYLSSQEFELARAEARVLSVEEAIE